MAKAAWPAMSIMNLNEVVMDKLLQGNGAHDQPAMQRHPHHQQQSSNSLLSTIHRRFQEASAANGKCGEHISWPVGGFPPPASRHEDKT